MQVAAQTEHPIKKARTGGLFLAARRRLIIIFKRILHLTKVLLHIACHLVLDAKHLAFRVTQGMIDFRSNLATGFLNRTCDGVLAHKHAPLSGLYHLHNGFSGVKLRYGKRPQNINNPQIPFIHPPSAAVIENSYTVHSAECRLML
ncbi:MAG: hypothetical protein JO089_04745 [Alphaproteobacteria bacterium]|nr:hypothetical protein [Alphaproteobacteria bacterium]